MEVQGKFFRNCREHQWISKNICMRLRVEKRNLVRFSTRERAWMGPTPYWHSLPQSKLFPPPLSFIFFPPDRSTAMLVRAKVCAVWAMRARGRRGAAHGGGAERHLRPRRGGSSVRFVPRGTTACAASAAHGEAAAVPASPVGSDRRSWRARERRTPASFL